MIQVNYELKINLDEPATDEEKEEVKKKLKKEMLDSSYGNSIINLLIDKLTDVAESVVLESLNSLQQMMEFLSTKAVIPCLTNLLGKLRPCFDINNHNVRSLGFKLFNRIISLVHSNEDISNLLSLDKDDLKDGIKIDEIIKEQIHVHLVSLIMHSNDENDGVRHRCIETLLKALHIMLGEDVKPLLDAAKDKFNPDFSKVYDEFLLNISDLLVQKFASRVPYHIANCINHALSPQDNIRASSVYLISIFFDKINKNRRTDIYKNINFENIFLNFAKLMKDFSSKVKIKAIKALVYFKNLQSSDY